MGPRSRTNNIVQSITSELLYIQKKVNGDKKIIHVFFICSFFFAVVVVDVVIDGVIIIVMSLV
jgi:hypothetical protein